MPLLQVSKVVIHIQYNSAVKNNIKVYIINQIEAALYVINYVLIVAVN